MITGYIPSKEHVIESLFGLCSHKVVNDSTPPYCDKCNSFVQDSVINDMDKLETALSETKGGIGGGIYVDLLVNFLIKYGDLSFSGRKGTKWYGLCYVLSKGIFEGKRIVYKSKTTNAFAYNVCWLSEILFRLLLSEKYSETEIRRIINDS